MRSRRTLFVVLAVGLVAGCGDSTGPEGMTSIMMQASGQVAQQELVISGSNGTLRITGIQLIVDELELEPAETNGCDDEDESAGSPCVEFETRAFLVSVPVDGTPVAVSHVGLAPGLYGEVEFEVDDVEVDADEAGESGEILALLATVRQQFPDWPEKASMVVEGSFTPTGGQAVSFRVYFEAEIEVELELQPPLQVTSADQTILIEVRPDLWFKRTDGTVWELSQFDFAVTQQIVEFELEIEHGFEVEVHD